MLHALNPLSLQQQVLADQIECSGHTSVLQLAYPGRSESRDLAQVARDGLRDPCGHAVIADGAAVGVESFGLT